MQLVQCRVCDSKRVLVDEFGRIFCDDCGEISYLADFYDDEDLDLLERVRSVRGDFRG